MPAFRNHQKPLNEIVEKCLEQLKGQDFSNRTLARQIYDDHQDLFTGIDKNEAMEVIRSKIRYVRGCKGKKNSKYANPEFVREEMKPSEYMAAYIQKGETTAQPVWHLPKQYRKVLVLSDLHIPYHHLESINAALDYGFERGIDCIYINGDLLDFADISRWAKDKKVRSVQYEIDLAREFLEGLTLLGVKLIYKCGNHDYRLNKFLANQAPQLQDLEDIQLTSLLGLQELGIEFIHDKQRAKFGKLSVLHGHEFGESVFSPVNPARGLFLRAKSSVLAGHNHQTSAHHENNLNGEATACFSTGCLCDLQPDYRPFAFTKWNHGAAIIEVAKDGNFSVENFRIIDGRIY